MSVPFANTHLRVPRGFDTILEGLTREVLRDQPDDIPKYAAQYFETLLKQRQGNRNLLFILTLLYFYLFLFFNSLFCSFKSIQSLSLFFLLLDSGVDPVDWATKLEDDMYNNDAFEVREALDQSMVCSKPLLSYRTNLFLPLWMFFSIYFFFFQPNRLLLKRRLQQRKPFPSESLHMC